MGRKIWDFLRELAWPFGLCGGLYAIISKFIPLESQTNLLGAMAIGVFFIALTITLSGYCLRKEVQNPDQISIAQIINRGDIIIVHKSDLLGINMSAMIYYKDDIYERLIAIADVIHVQLDGLTQLSVNYVPGVEYDLLDRISENTRSIKSSLIIRPGVRIVNIESAPTGEPE